MKIYKLSKIILVFNFSVLGLATLFWIFVAISELTRSSSGLTERGFTVFGLLALLWVWWGYLKIPYEIKIYDHNSIEFRSFLKRTVISPHEIKSIKGVYLSYGFIRLRYSRGAIQLINKMDGFYDFISTIKSINPTVECKNC
ncbi:hypothetical protein [Candidatus Manganitrophus noduliformans]|uniref:Uncharacterized protein n=1 Tax=Candidatus Manganitrophus noduliformans TaxID=2606439 RepID=A0A7X6IAN4_9BACT|nr:hypothetical protein [Candidatus Manganitrophus noduliformans]NKE70569.1 hypothetical protein [Candidatus Manganitrophus noduliformans]